MKTYRETQLIWVNHSDGNNLIRGPLLCEFPAAGWPDALEKSQAAAKRAGLQWHGSPERVAEMFGCAAVTLINTDTGESRVHAIEEVVHA